MINHDKYNTYIGARYVPLFDGIWDNTKQYEPLVIVQYQGNSYTSKTYVPVGVDITNETYWAITGNYNAQIEAYREEVRRYTDKIDAFKNTSDKIIVNVLNPPGELSPLVNDGATDNTPMLQAIIEYCGVNGGIIWFAPGTYMFNSTVFITSNGIDIVGCGLQQTVLKSNFKGTLLDWSSKKYCSIKNINLQGTQKDSIGIDLNGCNIFQMFGVNIYNFKVGLHLTDVSNSNFEYSIISTDGTEANAKGVLIKGKSVSTYLTKIIVNLSASNGSIAIENSGNNVADNIISQCDIANSYIGILMNGESSTQNASTDITIENCVVDGTYEHCIYIYHMQNSAMINIKGGWLNARNVPNSKAIVVDSSEGVSIDGVMFQTLNIDPFNQVKYVYLTGASKCKVVNSTFYNGFYQIELVSSNHIVIANNNSKMDENSVNPLFVVASQSGHHNMIVNNSLTGWYGYGIELISSEDKYIVTGNIIDDSHIVKGIQSAATNSIIKDNIAKE